MSSLKNLPPQVARELRRHVSPQPLPKPGVLLKRMQEERRQSMRTVAAGCLAFTAAAASLPLAAHYWIGGLNDKEEALTAPQVRRGAFLNTGSRDLGRDPDWDLERGAHRHKLQDRAGYAGMVEHEKEEKKKSSAAAALPGEYLAMPADAMEKHEEKIKAFAEGRGSNN